MRRGRALRADSGVTVRIVPRFVRAFQGAKRLRHGVLMACRMFSSQAWVSRRHIFKKENHARYRLLIS